MRSIRLFSVPNSSAPVAARTVRPATAMPTRFLKNSAVSLATSPSSTRPSTYDRTKSTIEGSNELGGSVQDKVKAGYYDKEKPAKDSTATMAATARKPSESTGVKEPDYDQNPKNRTPEQEKEDFNRAENTASFSFRPHEPESVQRQWEAQQSADWDPVETAAMVTDKVKNDMRETVGYQTTFDRMKGNRLDNTKDFDNTRYFDEAHNDSNWEAVKDIASKAGDKKKEGSYSVKASTREALGSNGSEDRVEAARWRREGDKSKPDSNWEAVKDMAAKAGEKVKETFYTAKASVKETVGSDATADRKEADKVRKDSRSDKK